jgi:polyphosphate kinase
MSELPKYINRELSWLEFNQRVLDEALNTDNRALERLKFLAITASNMEEFFMVRVGGLQLVNARGSSSLDPAGLNAAEQLQAIAERTRTMVNDQYRCFLADIEPELAEAGLVRVKPADFTSAQREAVRQIFQQEIYSVLTPMAVSGVDQFPHLVGGRLHVAVQLPPHEEGEPPRFSIIPCGRVTSRIITVKGDGGYCYTLLEEVIADCIGEFFPGITPTACAAFRITRNADLAVRDDMAGDLLAEMEEVLDARRTSHVVRLEIHASATPEIRELLREGLNVDAEFIYDIPGPLDLSNYMSLIDLAGFDKLRDERWRPQQSPQVDPTEDIFKILSERDVLLYHPFDSFEPVLQLIEAAADDPDVLAIKQILYRTSRNSPIVAALRRAAKSGKHVTAIVELKARFDEARNIEWAKDLEQAEVQVIYGVKHHKTHAKVCIIVRREPHGIVRYVHFGTGNYNESTARLYTDASLMTSKDEYGDDATAFFNTISGYSQPQQFLQIEAAPIGLRDKLLEMIEGERQRAEAGDKAAIYAKFNSLADPKLIDALYAASQAGVEIKLNVRGICCLRPGVPGLSENIEVLSIVDRFLEHARIIYFEHGGDGVVFISSADWMPRNLDRRVELLVPVIDPDAKQKLIAVLKTCFSDNVKGRRLLPDGSYQPIERDGKRRKRSQEILYKQAVAAVKLAEQSRRLKFEPHQPSE